MGHQIAWQEDTHNCDNPEHKNSWYARQTHACYLNHVDQSFCDDIEMAIADATLGMAPLAGDLAFVAAVAALHLYN